MATKTIDIVTQNALSNLIKDLLKTEEYKKQIFDIDHPKDSEYITNVQTDMSSLSNGTWSLKYHGKIGGTTTTTMSGNVSGTCAAQNISIFSNGSLICNDPAGGLPNPTNLISAGGSGGSSQVWWQSVTGTHYLYYAGGLGATANASSLSNGKISSGSVDISKATGAIEIYIYVRTL